MTTASQHVNKSSRDWSKVAVCLVNESSRDRSKISEFGVTKATCQFYAVVIVSLGTLVEDFQVDVATGVIGDDA